MQAAVVVDDLAGVQADAQLQAELRAAAVQPRDAALDILRAGDRAPGRLESHHDPVAGVGDHDAALLLDLRPRQLRQLALDRRRRVVTQALVEQCGADEVGREHRDGAFRERNGVGRHADPTTAPSSSGAASGALPTRAASRPHRFRASPRWQRALRRRDRHCESPRSPSIFFRSGGSDVGLSDVTGSAPPSVSTLNTFQIHGAMPTVDCCIARKRRQTESRIGTPGRLMGGPRGHSLFRLLPPGWSRARPPARSRDSQPPPITGVSALALARPTP